MENTEEKIKLSFEYFWKYYGKWSICSTEQMLHIQYNFKYMIFKRRQKALLWSKGLIKVQTSLINIFVIHSV